ncbi:MAG TPA: hypothetical protein VGS22_03600 [Thermoanaerobaculia bacterium]|nr:hypothetical protein [Thermoanaerobaculia bacterium]
MSLIDEALKRARHEASRQEAVKRDAARHDGPRPIPKLYAERQSSRAPLWAGIATGAAVALLGVVAWLLWGRAPSTPPAAVSAPPPVVVAEAPKVFAPPPAPAPAAVHPPSSAPAVEAPKSAPPPASTAPLVRPTAETSASPPTRSPVTPSAPAAAPPKVPAPRPAAPPTAASAPPSYGLQVFVREVYLPGGGPHLRLGGIAYSEEAPIALINGAALGRGEVVEGYVIRRIDAAEVELEGPGGRVVLRLK